MDKVDWFIDWKKVDPLLKAGSNIGRIARKFGVSRWSLYLRKRKLGLGTKRTVVSWAKIDPVLAKLGTMQIVRKFKVSVHSVKRRRKLLGISNPADRRRSVPWEKIDRELATIPDVRLAKKYGCSLTAINLRRRQLCIGPHYVDEGAKMPGARYERIFQSCPDEIVGRLTMVHPAVITKIRKKLGLPNCHYNQFLVRKAERQLFRYLMEGGLSMTEIGSLYGITHERVRQILAMEEVLKAVRGNEVVAKIGRRQVVIWPRIDPLLAAGRSPTELSKAFGISPVRLSARQAVLSAYARNFIKERPASLEKEGGAS